MFVDSAILQRDVEIKPPERMVTPYGGRLTWILPGKNKLVVHVKNKKKIRNRKRWSQVYGWKYVALIVRDVLVIYISLSYSLRINKRVNHARDTGEHRIKQDSIAGPAVW